MTPNARDHRWIVLNSPAAKDSQTMMDHVHQPRGLGMPGGPLAQTTHSGVGSREVAGVDYPTDERLIARRGIESSGQTAI